VRWTDLETRQPRLATVARERLLGPRVLLVATIRRDGTPRLSPVEPYVLDGELLLSMLWGSRKATDLERDPRVLVHSVVTGPEGGAGEVKVRGLARAVTDPDVQARYAAAVSRDLGWSPEVGRFHLVAVDIAQVTYVRYDHATGDQFLTIWPDGVEQVRRGTGATTLGEAEPLHEVLVPER
jgi:Pyridoxamine 5'-phosphate oxidase